MRFLFLLCILFLLTACSQEIQTIEPVPTMEFCGRSTEAPCIEDKDCVERGCSGEICQTSSEEERISACEYRDCYNAELYSLSCSCVDNFCEWG